MKNYYKLLEVPNDADISTLRSAFRKKAKSCHPDLFQHVSPEERKNLQKKFVRLSQAYETLADPKKRHSFDQSLRKSSVKARQQNVRNTGQLQILLLVETISNKTLLFPGVITNQLLRNRETH